MRNSFRARVIIAALVVSSLAVLLSCGASYVTTRNALVHSVDQSLLQSANPNLPDDNDRGGLMVLANGTVLSGPKAFADSTITRYAASGDEQPYFRTTRVEGQWFRELLLPNTVEVPTVCGEDICQQTEAVAEVFVTSFNGQMDQLHRLLRGLLLVGASVLLFTVALGLWFTQRALRPLERVTNDIEFIAESRDVSRRIEEGGDDELGRLRRVFNNLLINVDASQQLQRQLVQDASHELRTPLTSLRTNAQVLNRAHELDVDDLRQLTDDMVAQVDELSHLITDLGELSRGEHSEGAVVQIRLDELVEECVETARTYARIKNIDINVTTQPSIAFGRGDRLERAVSNLLTNAIKFTPEGGKVRVVVNKGSVIVGDSGPGVDAQDAPRIFDRFYRAAKSRGLPGSGLGLSIVQQVVNEFAGHVEVGTDEVLGGAKFTLTLPHR